MRGELNWMILAVGVLPILADAGGNGRLPAKVKVESFHPGHWVFVGNDKREKFDFLKECPEIVGAKKVYEWRALEPAEGRYDFSEIEGDLKYLEAMGKRFWIRVGHTAWSKNGKAKTPEYMWTDPKYGGHSKWYGNYPRGERGWYPVFWNPHVKARWAALCEALGKRFNKEPYFEGFSLGETAVKRADEYGWTREGIEEAFKFNALAAKKAFPDKIVMQHINFASYDLAVFSAWLAENGIGIGGPDVGIPKQEGSLISKAYAQYARFHDVVATGPDVQWGNYTGKNPRTGEQVTSEELLAFAIESMNPWYMFWLTREPYFTRDVLPAIRKHGPLPAVRARQANEE
ncbi:MAG: beta-galactosidase [Kiritimatiellae bacterium]|nr:beta-galactosidase [Kiritimatiellia bacterium]